jgi:DNA helicase IV
MVLDWRAPISRKFYQASVKDPQGVANRRRFGFVRGEQDCDLLLSSDRTAIDRPS